LNVKDKHLFDYQTLSKIEHSAQLTPDLFLVLVSHCNRDTVKNVFHMLRNNFTITDTLEHLVIIDFTYILMLYYICT
jgi:hypothetical protein